MFIIYSNTEYLTRSGGRLSTVGNLSGLEFRLLTLGRTGGLDLLGTLLGLLRFLLLLGSGNISSASSLTDGSRLLTLGNNLLPGGTNDGTLNLNGLASTLLGNFLSGALLVKTTEEDSPVILARILLLQEVRLALAVKQTEALNQAIRSGG